MEAWHFRREGKEIVIVLGSKGLPALESTTLEELLSVLNGVMGGTLTRAIKGVAKVRTARGPATHPLTQKINEHYHRQRELCIEMLEDLMNITWHIIEMMEDPMNITWYIVERNLITMYEDFSLYFDEIIREYQQSFKKNTQDFGNNCGQTIIWDILTGTYDERSTKCSSSSWYPSGYPYIILVKQPIEHRHRVLRKVSVSPSKFLPHRQLQHRRQRRGDKCVSRNSLRNA
jgi:hypothetical protein